MCHGLSYLCAFFWSLVYGVDPDARRPRTVSFSFGVGIGVMPWQRQGRRPSRRQRSARIAPPPQVVYQEHDQMRLVSSIARARENEETDYGSHHSGFHPSPCSGPRAGGSGARCADARLGAASSEGAGAARRLVRPRERTAAAVIRRARHGDASRALCGCAVAPARLRERSWSLAPAREVVFWLARLLARKPLITQRSPRAAQTRAENRLTKPSLRESGAEVVDEWQ